MKFSKLVFAVALAISAQRASAHANTIYDVDLSVGAATVTGSITTDGTLGAIGGPDILAWDLDVTDGTSSFETTRSNSTIGSGGSALTATATELLFDYDSGPAHLLFSDAQGGEVCFYTSKACGTEVNGNAVDFFQVGSPPTDYNIAVSGTQIIASAAAVPEPRTVALFGAAFFMLGGLAWRRRYGVASK